jgi:hypothetical protein
VESKSFDIYSPKIGALIEMHGDFWHKLGPKSQKMEPLIKSNIANDALKKAIAEAKGFKYIVFWQSEHPNWIQKIGELYGTVPTKSLQEASDQINQKLGTKRSL